MRERAFSKKLQRDTQIVEAIRNNIGNRYYKPISMRATTEEALAELANMPMDQAINEILQNQVMPSHVECEMGQVVIRQLNDGQTSVYAAVNDSVRAARVVLFRRLASSAQRQGLAWPAG
jgi:hypothetical protein